MADDIETEKVFVSYSWTTPDHEQWVLNLAQELTDRGVHVIIDKWDLAEGQDSNAFMERMVSDPTVTKVLMICDKMYAEKADTRKGGAGTEAQIMSPHIYASAVQKKFVALLREKDPNGKAYVPVYYGSRIFIDFSDDNLFAEKFIQLERWIANKPLHVRPPLGKRPAYLDEDAPVRMPTVAEHRQALDALRGGKATALPAVDDYLRLITAEIVAFRLDTSKSGDAAEVLSLIQQTLPVRDEVISVVVGLVRYRDDEASWDIVGSFFERLLAHDDWPEDVGTWSDIDADHFRFLTKELFLHLLGFALAQRRFSFARFLLSNQMYYTSRRRTKGDLVSFLHMSYHSKAIDIINRSSKPQYYSLEGKMLVDRAAHGLVTVDQIAQADFVAYLFSRLHEPKSFGWFPLTVFHTGWLQAINFEIFIRAKSKKFLQEVLKIFGVNRENFESFIEKLEANTESLPTLGSNRLHPREMMEVEKWGTTP